MNAQQILDLISPIPADKFTTYFFVEDDKHCVAGHVIKHLNTHIKLQQNQDYYSVSLNKIRDILWDRKIGGYSLVNTNNNSSPAFPQDNPKDRCIAWLNMAIEEDDAEIESQLNGLENSSPE